MEKLKREDVYIKLDTNQAVQRTYLVLSTAKEKIHIFSLAGLEDGRIDIYYKYIICSLIGDEYMWGRVKSVNDTGDDKRVEISIDQLYDMVGFPNRKNKFVSSKRMARLEKSMSWLSDYKGPALDETHLVGNSLDDVDLTKTSYLSRLASINKEREELIKKLTD